MMTFTSRWTFSFKHLWVKLIMVDIYKKKNAKNNTVIRKYGERNI